MLVPPIRVARPADWTGRLAFVAVWLLFAVVLLVAMLVRLPDAWVESLPTPLIVRGATVLVLIVVTRWLGAIAFTRLPGAAFLSGRRVVFRERGRRHRVPLSDVVAIVVELRPPPVHEMFVLRMRDGSEHDLCPVHWAGAGRLYAALARRIGSRARRA